MSRSAIFLDRDGTLNEDTNHLYRIEDWRWIPGAKTAIRRFKEEGFLVFVVTNQSGIARGIYTASDVNRLHELINYELKAEGVEIDGFYFCPHHPDFGDRIKCNCRKPRPGMLYQAASEHCIELEKSWIIGDKLTDTTAGIEAGSQAILISYSDDVSLEGRIDDERFFVTRDIICAVDCVLANSKDPRLG
jgi:D-glycero-D-manno-heptose 1,7-bisphosphate phosphatase